MIFFNIPMYQALADFGGWFTMKSKSRKTFDITISKKKKTFIFKFRFCVWGLPDRSLPPTLGCANDLLLNISFLNP
jgi:hypothetical protein